MKWAIQILVVGILVAIWAPAYFAEPEPVHEAIVMLPPPPEEPEYYEERAMALPPDAGTVSGRRPAAVIESPNVQLRESYERELAAYQAKVDSMMQVRPAAQATVSSLNEWLTLITSIISLITFGFQIREWKKKKQTP